MPNGLGDDAPVSWGRFTATIGALEVRIAGVERQESRQADRVEQSERALAAAEENRRLLSVQTEQLSKSVEGRRQRTWALTMLILTSVALPILVSLILVWLHIKG